MEFLRPLVAKLCYCGGERTFTHREPLALAAQWTAVKSLPCTRLWDTRLHIHSFTNAHIG